MRFPSDFLDEIRERVPISDVVGRRVTFDRKKSNPSRGDFWACCPFHGEKTPSFHCENAKGRYYCFGCGASGDHFRFMTELDGVAFPEAVERLAAEAGLPMPTVDPQTEEKERKHASLHDVMALAATFFQEQLQAAKGAEARAYLRGRELPPKVQQRFAMGYAPGERSALKEYLGAKGVLPEQMEACGLVVHGPDIPVPYDRFRDRIMFPILDARERVIAFGGRALSSDVPAKYLNSPETDLFSKSNVLYNYAAARKACGKGESLIIVEGYMDAIALAAAGFENVVAPLGTALTDRQMDLAWRIGGEPVLCFDGDQAGLRAAFRSLETALPQLRPGRSLRFALMPEGQDPDDLVRAHGREAMQEAINRAIPLADMLWRRETEGNPLDTPERRAELEAEFKNVVARIGDESVRRHYQQDIRERLNAFFGRRQYNRDARSGSAPSNGRALPGQTRRVAVSDSLLKSSLMNRQTPLPPLRETVLVVTIANHPAVCVEFFDSFAGLELDHPLLARLQSVICDVFAEMGEDDDQVSLEHIAQALTDAGLEADMQRLNAQLSGNRIWQALPEAAFEDARDGWRQTLELHNRNRLLNRELKNAEAHFADSGDERSWDHLVSLHREIALTEGLDALIDGFGLSSGRPMRNF